MKWWPAAPDETGRRQGWQRSTWPGAVTGWHAAFWIVIALGLISTLAGPVNDDRGGRTVPIAVLVSLAGTYLLAAPHLGRGRIDGQLWVYVGTAVVGTGVACWSDATLSLLLFIVYPQMWIFAGRRLWVGIALTLALTTSSLIGFIGAGGWTWQATREIAPQMAVSMLFSLLLGVWISRIVQQSIERGELIAELEAAREELAGAHHSQGVMAERERMAREIHDTLAQGFTSIVMLAQAAGAGLTRDPARAAERLSMIEEVARENLAEARALVAAFAPLPLDGSGVREALQRLAERFGRETGLVVDLDIVGDLQGLHRDREVVLLRVVQESLTNVRRHAQARTVRIRVVSDCDGVRVEVGDDGAGFAVADAAPGFGLRGMSDRLSEIGGHVDVASAPGAGTVVRVRVPRSAVQGAHEVAHEAAHDPEDVVEEEVR